MTLKKAIAICKSKESSRQQARALTASGETNVHSVHSKRGRGRGYKSSSGRGQGNYRPTDRGQGRRYGKKCHNCGGYNHFKRLCRTKQIHAVDGCEDYQEKYDEEQEFYIESIHRHNDQNDRQQLTCPILIEGHQVHMKVDTGAGADILPYKIVTEITDSSLTPTKHKLFGYSGKQLEVKGTCQLSCKFKNDNYNVTFYVVNTNAPPVLGLQTSLKMGLIKTVLAVDVVNNILDDYPDLLQGIGLFPGEHSFTLDPTVKPVVHPQHRIPIALSDKVKRKLDEMEAQEVIQKETGPTEWVNSMVVVEKPGGQDIRICLDPKNLNQAIKREHYPMKTLEDVKHKLAGARLFSKLDAKGAY